MKKIDHFVNQYPIHKTLRFSLIPQGKTQENFEKAKILEEDEKRAAEYKKIKVYIDRCHKAFIERALTDYELPYLEKYAALYYKSRKSSDDIKLFLELQKKMRQDISNQFIKNEKNKPEYELLIKECSKLVKNHLPKVVDKNEESIVCHFKRFATSYIRPFCKKRENMYTGKGCSTEIAFRIVDQNLPRFLDNCRLRDRVLSSIPCADLDHLKDAFSVGVEDIFELSFFHRTMRQSQIDIYNQIIGGYTEEGGIKKKGINEYIIEYNQNAEKKIPKLKPLYKQILSDRSSVSFIPEKFNSDNELLSALRTAYETPSDGSPSFKELSENILQRISCIDKYDLSRIYVKSDTAVNSLSKSVFGKWDMVQIGLERQYDRENGTTLAKNPEKYREKRDAYIKKLDSVSLSQMQAAADEVGENPPKIEEWFLKRATELQQALDQSYKEVKSLLSAQYPPDRKLCGNDKDIARIKLFLDCLKDVQKFAELLLGSGKEAEKDELFYGEFLPKYDAFALLTPLYDKVRNYVTQKPYSTDKIRLNFDCSSFLNGWAQDYSSKSALLFRKDGVYYLGIVATGLNDNDLNAMFSNIEECPAEQLHFNYQKPDKKNVPRLFIRSKKDNKDNFAPGVRQYDLPIEEILDIYDNELYKSENRQIDPQKQKEALIKLIDYYKLGFSRHESYKKFEFSWKESSEYKDIEEFFQDVMTSCYQIIPQRINFAYLLRLTETGKLYLFKIFNKDFSEHSHGTPNLHTLYFKELFSPENLKNVVFQLNGGAEMFYRRASIKEKDRIVHPANHPIENKNPLSERKTSAFTYDMIKDRRFTVDKFFLHIPITLNFKAPGKTNLNMDIRSLLHEEKKSFVIGIDRGERNLLYICVVDPDGNIVEQRSLNEIINDYNGQTYRTDYHVLLDKRGKERRKARKDWQTIEGIKELKEGYISQAVHVICQLIEKYDAVIAIEDLNLRRPGVEKQVYQKFEKMLIDKLNFYADKQRELDEVGSIRRAYQLTNRFESFSKMGKQNGIIFYVPAWLTSKIDPTTGFVNLLKTRYESIPAAQKFFGTFDRIAFNNDTGLFEFDVDYSKFPYADTDYRKKWKVCSFGKRIESFRNPEKNSNWDTREIDLTAQLHELFAWYGLDETAEDLRPQIVARTEKDFFVRLLKLISLMLQMRNSIPNSAIDYLISPVRNRSGEFFASNTANANLPADADANGAYHIALKGLWAIQQIAEHDGDLFKVKIAISNKQWLAFAQSRCD